MNHIISSNSFRLLMNRDLVRRESYASSGRADILSLSSLEKAKREITSWPGYEITALRPLAGLARALGLKAIWYKDESARFGLGSFKALGGAYAVATILQEEVLRRTGCHASSAELISGKFRCFTEDLTVVCATEGNHGRSVAWGASMFGCRCMIYVHHNVTHARRSAIEAYGAQTRVVEGTYDDSVRQVATDARQFGWRVVSDTTYQGYTGDIPRKIMQGYGVLIDECYRQIARDAAPTHVFIQAGVGGLAASVCSYVWQKFERDAPFLFVIEPEKAQSILLSAEACERTAAQGDLKTNMSGLACGEVSLLAWSILEKGVDGFLAIPDDAVAQTRKMLANSLFQDAPIFAGESAVAGLTGLVLAAQEDGARRQTRLNEESVVLLVGTEGVTDAGAYE
jgi:diaminopropionate ammonia-lyase